MATLSNRIEASNYHHLVMDIAWFGISFATTSRFLQFFALRMGATPMELAWMTSLPSLVLVFATLLSAWWRNRYETTMQAIWYPAIVYRLMFLLPMFAPFFPEHLRVVWLILSAVLPAIAQGIVSAIFLIMMREAVSEETLSRLFTRRHLAFHITLILAAVGFGFMLEHIAFPTNYQIMFALGFAFSLVSQWHLGKVIPRGDGSERPKALPKRTLRALFADTKFQSVAWVTFIAYLTFYFSFALIPLHLKETLGATEGFLGIYGGVEIFSALLAAFVMNRLFQRYGNRAMITWGLVANGLAVVVIALAPDMWLTLFGAAVTGLAWSIISVAVLGFFAERTAPNDMQASVVFHQILFTATVAGPLLGNGIVNVGFSVVSVLLLGAGLRVFGGILTWQGLRVFGKKRVEPIYK